MEVFPPDVPLIALDHMRYALEKLQMAASHSHSTPDAGTYFQRLLRNLYRNPDLTVYAVERLRSRLHNMFAVQATDSTMYVVKCMPARGTRLLRHEHKSLETEGRILDLIASSGHIPTPRKLHQDLHTNNTIHCPYLLRSYIPGSSLADLGPHVTISERARIDRALGAYMHSLTQLRVNSFGTTAKVFAQQGCNTWSQAFRILLESALRDAEDVLVSLPYDAIRYYTSANKSALDEVTDARLVPLDAGTPQKVILDPRCKHVVGLLGFSNVVWGDPLLASVFVDASEAFWEGFGGRPDDDVNYQTRILLYHVYHSMVAVAAQYQRPTAEGEDLQARRTLTWALSQLSELG